MQADLPVGVTDELNEHRNKQPKQIILDVWGHRQQKWISFDQRSGIIAVSKR